MKSENTENLPDIGEMQKRRVLMADERRYLIYYTFGKESDSPISGGTKSETRYENESVLNPSIINANSSIMPEERENV